MGHYDCSYCGQQHCNGDCQPEGEVLQKTKEYGATTQERLLKEQALLGQVIEEPEIAYWLRNLAGKIKTNSEERSLQIIEKAKIFCSHPNLINEYSVDPYDETVHCHCPDCQYKWIG